jgi:hypothetical protein
MPLGRDAAQLGQPPVVGACAGPLQLGLHTLRAQAQPRIEGRAVELGDAVGEDDFDGDPVSIEHLDPSLVVPGARQPRPVLFLPFLVELVDEEELGHLLALGDLGRKGLVEAFAVLRVEIVAVLLGR